MTPAYWAQVTPLEGILTLIVWAAVLIVVLLNVFIVLPGIWRDGRPWMRETLGPRHSGNVVDIETRRRQLQAAAHIGQRAS